MFGWLSAASDLCFALEPREPLWIGGKQLRQHLDRHLAMELRIARAIDLAHSARADRAEDFIGTYESSCGYRHVSGVRGLYAAGVSRSRGSTDSPRSSHL